MANVKQKIAWLWRNAEKVLLVTFFLTFTFNIRKVFLTPYSFLNGGYNEYMTMSFSWADLLILATIVIYTTKSILRQVINPYYAPFHGKVGKKSFTSVSRKTLYLFIFLGWAGISIFWSQYRPLAAYRLLTFIEIALFAVIAAKSLNNGKWIKLAILAIILNGFFQSLLGIAQFIHNSALGFQFLGESVIGPNIDGVAKIIFHGENHIRAYGTLPHPNILAGFLLVPLFLIIGTLLSRRLSLPGKQQDGVISDLPIILSRDIPHALHLPDKKKQGDVSYETFLDFIPKLIWYAILFITGLGFFLTFSRSAFLGFFVGALIFLSKTLRARFQDEMSGSNLKLLASSIIFLTFALLLMLNNTSFFSYQSIQERTLYQNVSYETFLKHPFAGVGVGQFVMNEYRKHPNMESWQYQPVHNLYLLLLSELGMVGLLFFLLWIFSIIKWGIGKNGNTGVLLTCSFFCCIVFSFLFISFFDHYFWDIKSGTLILVLPFVLIFYPYYKFKKCSTKFFRLL